MIDVNKMLRFRQEADKVVSYFPVLPFPMASGDVTRDGRGASASGRRRRLCTCSLLGQLFQIVDPTLSCGASSQAAQQLSSSGSSSSGYVEHRTSTPGFERGLADSRTVSSIIVCIF